jgi:hypothetical protein
MSYYHTEDIGRTKKFNANNLDEKMKLCINRVFSALVND